MLFERVGLAILCFTLTAISQPLIFPRGVLTFPFFTLVHMK